LRSPGSFGLSLQIPTGMVGLAAKMGNIRFRRGRFRLFGRGRADNRALRLGPLEPIPGHHRARGPLSAGRLGAMAERYGANSRKIRREIGEDRKDLFSDDPDRLGQCSTTDEAVEMFNRIHLDRHCRGYLSEPSDVQLAAGSNGWRGSVGRSEGRLRDPGHGGDRGSQSVISRCVAVSNSGSPASNHSICACVSIRVRFSSVIR
jgi:hypothetical protein